MAKFGCLVCCEIRKNSPAKFSNFVYCSTREKVTIYELKLPPKMVTFTPRMQTKIYAQSQSVFPISSDKLKNSRWFTEKKGILRIFYDSVT